MSADQDDSKDPKEAKERPDIGEAATLPASLESAGMLGVPGPKLDGLVDEAERARVLGALFGVSSQSFQQALAKLSHPNVVQLGQGGMGVVLEVLHGDLGERDTARLRREAQAMAKLLHHAVELCLGRIKQNLF